MLIAILTDDLIFFNIQKRISVSLKADAIGRERRIEGHGQRLLAIVDKDLDAEAVQHEPELDLTAPIPHKASAVMDEIPVEAGHVPLAGDGRDVLPGRHHEAP